MSAAISCRLDRIPFVSTMETPAIPPASHSRRQNVRKVIVTNNITLDGVMQAPGRPDEDLRAGFTHGGWALPYNDAVKARTMAEGMSEGADLLFGRRTYEDFFKVWPSRT